MFDFDTSELTRLSVDLAAAPAKVRAKVGAVVRACAMRAWGIMETESPVDTGMLRGSIGVDFGAGDGTLTAVVGPTVSYAPYVAYGTRRMAPNAFDLRTAEAIGPVFEQAVAAVAGDWL